MNKESVFQPMRWIVTISITNSLTGETIPVMQHSCRDRHHAATLLSEVRELAEDLAEFLPGITAAGYELAQAGEPKSSASSVAE